jgi:hypothetical protein
MLRLPEDGAEGGLTGLGNLPDDGAIRSIGPPCALASRWQHSCSKHLLHLVSCSAAR